MRCDGLRNFSLFIYSTHPLNLSAFLLRRERERDEEPNAGEKKQRRRVLINDAGKEPTGVTEASDADNAVRYRIVSLRIILGHVARWSCPLSCTRLKKPPQFSSIKCREKER
jgi:hypothetical protein